MWRTRSPLMLDLHVADARRLRCFLRHEEMTVHMAVAAAVHQSAYKPNATTHVDACTQTMTFCDAATCAATAAPAPVIEYVVTAPAITSTALSPVFEHVTPAPIDVFTAPARAIEYVAPSPAIDYVAPSSAATGVFANPQFYIFAVASASCRGRVRFARVHPSPSGTDRCRARVCGACATTHH